MKTLSDFPEYVAARAKLTEVQARHAAAVAERDSLLATIEGQRGRTETLADQAARLLEGDDGAVVDVGNLRDQYGRACRRVALLGEVVHLAKQRVEAERAKASATICEQARPEFAKLVHAELQVAHDLLLAQDRRREFWQSLNDSGVSIATLPSIAPLVRGYLTDPAATFWLRVADAVAAGYIEQNVFKMPERAPDRDSPLNHTGQHLLAAGPDGVGMVETTGDGATTRPIKGQWTATQAAPAWGDAA